jgi:hypothetical protein
LKKSCSKGVTVGWMSLEVLSVGPDSGNLGWSVSEIFSILYELGELNNDKPPQSNRNAKNRFDVRLI